jgi:hypothetical protein
LSAKYEKIAASVALVGLGLAVLLTDVAVLGIPIPGPTGRLGSVPAIWVMGVLLVAFSAGAAEAVARTAPYTELERLPKFTVMGLSLPGASVLWIQPALLTASGLVIIPLLQHRLVQAGAVLAFSFGLFAVLAGQQHLIEQRSVYHSLSVLGLNLATYLIAIGGYSAIYIWKLRSLVSGPLVAGFTFLIMLDFLWRTGQPLRRVMALSLVSGLVAAEIIWALNYWRASGFLGGTLLFFTFYLLSGMLAAYLLDHLRRRDMLEYGLVGTVGLFLIFAAALQRPAF